MEEKQNQSILLYVVIKLIFNFLLIYFVKTGNCIVNKITQYVDYLITWHKVVAENYERELWAAKDNHWSANHNAIRRNWINLERYL